MPKTIKIQVTQEHISRGFRYDSRQCPIALAVYEAVSSVLRTKYVVVHKGRICRIFTSSTHDDACNGVTGALSYQELHKHHRVVLPAKVVNFVDSFDAGKRMNPFSFEINLDTE